jgi:hypothetical protein
MVKGFNCQSYSIKMGRDAYFFKCADVNPRPQEPQIIKEAEHHGNKTKHQ